MWIRIVVLFLIICASKCQLSRFNPPQVPYEDDLGYSLKATPSILAKRAGYELKTYSVVTEDKYILSLYRIINKKNSNGPPVLFMNGIFVSARSWILRGKNEDLPFILTDLGYDVFIGGKRGNEGSDKHLKYKKSDKKYWDYSFHETGVYDLPAFIDLILNVTKYDKISYIGHSLGSAFFFVLASEKPEYMKKIAANVQFSPYGETAELKELDPFTQAYFKILRQALKFISSSQIFDLTPYIKIISNVLFACKAPILTNYCLATSKLIFGGSMENYDKLQYGYLLGASLGSVSIKLVQHLMRISEMGRFVKFDYGKKQNHIIYGTDYPPLYNLTSIDMPTLFFQGGKDHLVPPESIYQTIKSIGRNVSLIRMNEYNHIEFCFGKSAIHKVYPLAADFLDQVLNFNG